MINEEYVQIYNICIVDAQVEKYTNTLPSMFLFVYSSIYRDPILLWTLLRVCAIGTSSPKKKIGMGQKNFLKFRQSFFFFGETRRSYCIRGSTKERKTTRKDKTTCSFSLRRLRLHLEFRYDLYLVVTTSQHVFLVVVIICRYAALFVAYSKKLTKIYSSDFCYWKIQVYFLSRNI
jgi:hypothetical protein